MTSHTLCDFVALHGPPPRGCPDLQNWLSLYTDTLIQVDRIRTARDDHDPTQQELTDLYLPCDAPPSSIVVWDNTVSQLQTFWFNVEGSLLGGLWITIDLGLFPANIAEIEWNTAGSVGGGPIFSGWAAMPGAPVVNMNVTGEGYVLCGYTITTAVDANGVDGPFGGATLLRALIDGVPVPPAGEGNGMHDMGIGIASITNANYFAHTASWMKPVVMTPGPHTLSVEWAYYGQPGRLSHTGTYIGYTNWNNMFMMEVIG